MFALSCLLDYINDFFIECFYKVSSPSEVSELFSLKVNYIFSMIFIYVY